MPPTTPTPATRLSPSPSSSSSPLSPSCSLSIPAQPLAGGRPGLAGSAATKTPAGRRLSELPGEVLAHICSFVRAKDTVALRATCWRLWDVPDVGQPVVFVDLSRGPCALGRPRAALCPPARARCVVLMLPAELGICDVGAGLAGLFPAVECLVLASAQDTRCPLLAPPPPGTLPCLREVVLASPSIAHLEPLHVLEQAAPLFAKVSHAQPGDWLLGPDVLPSGQERSQHGVLWLPSLTEAHLSSVLQAGPLRSTPRLRRLRIDSTDGVVSDGLSPELETLEVGCLGEAELRPGHVLAAYPGLRRLRAAQQPPGNPSTQTREPVKELRSELLEELALRGMLLCNAERQVYLPRLVRLELVECRVYSWGGIASLAKGLRHLVLRSVVQGDKMNPLPLQRLLEDAPALETLEMRSSPVAAWGKLHVPRLRRMVVDFAGLAALELRLGSTALPALEDLVLVPSRAGSPCNLSLRCPSLRRLRVEPGAPGTSASPAHLRLVAPALVECHSLVLQHTRWLDIRSRALPCLDLSRATRLHTLEARLPAATLVPPPPGAALCGAWDPAPLGVEGRWTATQTSTPDVDAHAQQSPWSNSDLLSFAFLARLDARARTCLSALNTVDAHAVCRDARRLALAVNDCAVFKGRLMKPPFAEIKAWGDVLNPLAAHWSDTLFSPDGHVPWISGTGWDLGCVGHMPAVSALAKQLASLIDDDNHDDADDTKGEDACGDGSSASAGLKRARQPQDRDAEEAAGRRAKRPRRT